MMLKKIHYLFIVSSFSLLVAVLALGSGVLAEEENPGMGGWTPQNANTPRERIGLEFLPEFDKLSDDDELRILLIYQTPFVQDHIKKMTDAGAKVMHQFTINPHVAYRVKKSLFNTDIFNDPRINSSIDWDIPVKIQMESSANAVKTGTAFQKFAATGKNVKVAILDSGIASHPALKNKVIDSIDLTGSTEGPKDKNGHGTHAACVIACDNDKFQGIAPDTLLYNAKVIGANGEGYMSDVMAGIEWAMKQKVHIIHIGVTFTDPRRVCNGYDGLSNMIDGATRNGFLTVVPAGNYGNSELLPMTPPDQPAKPVKSIVGPGCANGALMVGQTDDVGNVLASSGRGPNDVEGVGKPDLVAPGYNVVAASVDNGSLRGDGTSVAASHVTAALALIKEMAGNRKNAAHLREILLSSTTPAQQSDVNATGRGLLNIEKALETLASQLPATTSTEEKSQQKEENDLDLESPVSATFRDITSKTKNRQEILTVIQHMVDNGNFVKPKNNLLRPGRKVKGLFITQIALALANVSCDKEPGQKLEEACTGKATTSGVLEKFKAGSYSKVETYALFMKAAGLKSAEGTVAGMFCADVKSKDPAYKILASAHRYNMLLKYSQGGKPGYCLPHAPLTRADALLTAYFALQAQANQNASQ